MLKRLWIARKFRRLISAPFDRQIADARDKHHSVKHLQAAKSQFLHQCLRGKT